MGVTKSLKAKLEEFSPEDLSRLIRMGWEDRTSFEAIYTQFDLTPNEFVKVMRAQLSPSGFKLWRKRISEKGHLKNEKKRGVKILRFKCSTQSFDGDIKGKK
jgi:uncharacterized protein (TIGR03643 family)